MPKKRRSKPSWLLTSLWTGAETHSLTKSHVRIFSESTRRCVTPRCSDRTVANKHAPLKSLLRSAGVNPAVLPPMLK